MVEDEPPEAERWRFLSSFPYAKFRIRLVSVWIV